MEYTVQELKKMGFLKQVQPDTFALRIKVVGGQVDAKLLPRLQALADRYGNGYVHLTARQSLEIPHIKLQDIPELLEALKESGLEASPTGPRLRTISSCQGAAICGSGNIDTTALAFELDERFGGRDLSHKFKIGVTGCRNNCLKAEENDLGIKGATTPEWNASPCTYCGACEKRCPVGAIKVDREAKTLSYDQSKCVHCGRCVKVCPTKAWAGKSGYLVYFAGLFGNTITLGRQLFPVIYSKEKLFEVIELTLQFFKENGGKLERFYHTLERVGWDNFRQHLAQIQWGEDDILKAVESNEMESGTAADRHSRDRRRNGGLLGGNHRRGAVGRTGAHRRKG